MSDDFYIAAGRRQMAVLEAAKASAQADLQSHRLNGDQESAAETIQTIATLDAQARELTALYNQYAASMAPPPEPSAEERAARPISRMDWSDVVEMTRQSKYAKNIRPDDPNMIAGYNEAMRRRQRGE
jgi:hypothetical protein